MISIGLSIWRPSVASGGDATPGGTTDVILLAGGSSGGFLLAGGASGYIKKAG